MKQLAHLFRVVILIVLACIPLAQVTSPLYAAIQGIILFMIALISIPE